MSSRRCRVCGFLFRKEIEFISVPFHSRHGHNHRAQFNGSRRAPSLTSHLGQAVLYFCAKHREGKTSRRIPGHTGLMGAMRVMGRFHVEVIALRLDVGTKLICDVTLSRSGINL